MPCLVARRLCQHPLNRPGLIDTFELNKLGASGGVMNAKRYPEEFQDGGGQADHGATPSGSGSGEAITMVGVSGFLARATRPPATLPGKITSHAGFTEGLVTSILSGRWR